MSLAQRWLSSLQVAAARSPAAEVRTGLPRRDLVVERRFGERIRVHGLVRYLVLFVIDLKTRRVHIAGITCQADGAWMAGIARRAFDERCGRCTAESHLPAGSTATRSTPSSSGTYCRPRAARPLRLPSRKPEPERLRRDSFAPCGINCLQGCILPLGVRHLRVVLQEFIEHYHAERNDCGPRVTSSPSLPFPCPTLDPESPHHVSRRQRLGGLLNFYERRAP